MAGAQLALPALLRRIDGEKADQLVGMRGYVASDVGIIDPQTAKPSLAAKDDRLDIGNAEPLVIFPADSEVHLDARLGPSRLLAEIIAKILRIAPGMAMD